LYLSSRLAIAWVGGTEGKLCKKRLEEEEGMFKKGLFPQKKKPIREQGKKDKTVSRKTGREKSLTEGKRMARSARAENLKRAA